MGGYNNNGSSNDVSDIAEVVKGWLGSSTVKKERPSTNPYSSYYKENFGYVFGRPFGFMGTTDPSDRVFQNTMLRNNTIVNIVPGVSQYQDDTLIKVKEILKKAEEEANNLRSKNLSPVEYEKAMIDLNKRYQDKLVGQRTDLRTSIFKKDIPGFLQSFQQLAIQVGTAMFGASFINSGIEMMIQGFTPDLMRRGFRVWTERATSVTESADNSYSSSMFEGVQDQISNLSKELSYMKGTFYGRGGEATTVVSNDATAQQVGSVATMAGTVLSGSKLILPKFWSDSSFQRSYEISYRFVSPYGDNQSIFFNVMLPFLFLLTCSIPRQDGPSGMKNPFMLQVDAPGFFSCPMGAVQSITFRKGGDNMWFNANGLPLMIEGSISVIDLYSALSIPNTYGEMLVNLGTRAYLNTLGGLTLYDTMDATLADSLTNRILSIAKAPTYPINILEETMADIRRVFGFTK